MTNSATTSQIDSPIAALGPVLVVDDEPELRRLIAAALRGQGWRTVEFATGAQVLAALSEHRPAVITLDINLQGESGYDVCRQIRAVSDVPVLFLTARSDEFDHVLGLELGADDFMTKPFTSRLLAARVAALARRGAPPRPPELLEAGGLRLDLNSRRAYVADSPVNVSKTEFDLLAIMLADANRMFTRQELVSRVWGDWHSEDDLTVLISRVRRKLSEAGAEHVIETVHGVGYRLARSN